MKNIKAVIIKGCAKGNSLIEIIAALAIMSLLTTGVIAVYIHFSRDFSSSFQKNYEEAYVTEAFRFIENELRKGDKEILIKESEITLKRFSAAETINDTDYIRKDEARLIIEHTLNGFHQSTNVFLRNVSDFYLETANGVLIVNITTSNGNKYTRCINTQYIDVKKVT